MEKNREIFWSMKCISGVKKWSDLNALEKERSFLENEVYWWNLEEKDCPLEKVGNFLEYKVHPWG